MMRWLKRHFKKPEEKAHDYTEINFREALQKFVPMGNTESDIFNEIETITFHKAEPDHAYSRPLYVSIKWRRLDYISKYTINCRLYGNEYLFEEFYSVIKSGYDSYRKTIMEDLTKKDGGYCRRWINHLPVYISTLIARNANLEIKVKMIVLVMIV